MLKSLEGLSFSERSDQVYVTIRRPGWNFLMADESSVELLTARNLLEKPGEKSSHKSLWSAVLAGEIVKGLSPVSSISYDKLPSLGPTTIAGHHGKLWLAKPQGIEVLIFQGHRHFYGEGWKPSFFPLFWLILGGRFLHDPMQPVEYAMI